MIPTIKNFDIIALTPEGQKDLIDISKYTAKQEGIFSQTPSPYLPFKIVNYMANFCLVPFVQASTQFHLNKTHTNLHVKTSCTDNLYALSIIFSGMKKAKFLVKERFLPGYWRTSSLKLSGGSNWDFKWSDFFTGKAISDKSIQDNQPWSTISGIAIEAFDNIYQATLKKCNQFEPSPSTQENNAKFIRNLENEFINLKYDFNEETFTSLKNDILSNKQKVNAQKSYVYYVIITLPVSAAHTDPPEAYHAFAIEQFLGLNGVSHRLYHSWIESMTLSDYFQKKGYMDQNDQGCLTTEQMQNYIDDVHRIISPFTDSAEKTRLVNSCFSQTRDQHPPSITYYPESHTLIGMVMRYVTQEINPKDTLDNFHEFIKAQAITSEME
jgi:hypothetical protein